MSKLLNSRNYSIFKSCKRFKTSALYITGDKAQTNFVALVPHVDFDDRLQNKTELLNNINARKLNIDLDKLEKRWLFYKTIDHQKAVLEATRAELSSMISKLKEDDKEAIEKLSLHRDIVRRDLKNIKDYSYGIEENAMLAALSFPNVLHDKITKLDECSVIYSFNEKPTDKSSNHIEIGEKNDLIHYANPAFYFLQNAAALFEHTSLNIVQSVLKTSNLALILFSNADFARSLIIEGCGASCLDPSDVYTLAASHNEKSQDISKLHLVGGASLYSFMAYFAKYSLQLSSLPLKLYTVGRSYQPCLSTAKSLFNISQESVVRIFMACSDDQEQVDQLFNQTIETVIDCYKQLNVHFRLVYLAPNQIHSSESLRLSIQMYSNYLDEYVEVGHLSQYDTYLSKRLLFVYNDANKERKFVKIISGSIISAQKVIACLIENNSNDPTKIINETLLSKYL